MQKNKRSWQSSASLETLRARARLFRSIRDYFDFHGVIEVDTSMLSSAGTVDRHIESLACQGDRWLHTSPEFAMKRLLACGVGSCFQLCHVFRGDPSSHLHEPEFTLLEWYRVDFDLRMLMNDIESLLNALGVCAGYWPRRTYRAVMLEHMGVDPFVANMEELRNALAAQGMSVATAAGADDERDVLLDAAMGLVVGPRLGMGAPCFVYHYPATQAALSRVSPNDASVCERFELFWQGVELANGYHELTDAQEQERRFIADRAWRLARGKPSPAADDALVDALGWGMPDCAGVALGVDRLLMLMLGLPRVGAAMAFDAGRA